MQQPAQNSGGSIVDMSELTRSISRLERILISGLEVTIKDNGVGISQLDIDNLFSIEVKSRDYSTVKEPTPTSIVNSRSLGSDALYPRVTYVSLSIDLKYLGREVLHMAVVFIFILIGNESEGK